MRVELLLPLSFAASNEVDNSDQRFSRLRALPLAKAAPADFQSQDFSRELPFNNNPTLEGLSGSGLRGDEASRTVEWDENSLVGNPTIESQFALVGPGRNSIHGFSPSTFTQNELDQPRTLSFPFASQDFNFPNLSMAGPQNLARGQFTIPSSFAEPLTRINPAPVSAPPPPRPSFQSPLLNDALNLSPSALVNVLSHLQMLASGLQNPGIAGPQNISLIQDFLAPTESGLRAGVRVAPTISPNTTDPPVAPLAVAAPSAGLVLPLANWTVETPAVVGNTGMRFEKNTRDQLVLDQTTTFAPVEFKNLRCSDIQNTWIGRAAARLPRVRIHVDEEEYFATIVYFDIANRRMTEDAGEELENQLADVITRCAALPRQRYKIFVDRQATDSLTIRIAGASAEDLAHVIDILTFSNE